MSDVVAQLQQQQAILGQVLETRGRRLARVPERFIQIGLKMNDAYLRALRSPSMSAGPAYAVDFAERWWLTADAFRLRGNQFVHDERAGHPPLLKFPYEVLIDGRSLDRPVNYSLLRIVGEREPLPDRRPYVIIDPRAGHGAGIGGFKPDSQVGVALKHGHPVYFVAFHPQPEPTQTIADITAAEAQFLRVVAALHPEARKPVVVGNCQGGWAAMLLAASNPDLTGVLMVNGAPLSYWAGVAGNSPMRYLGGLFGGALPAVALSDLGSGRFDGANLVLNFESNNPGRTWFKNFYDLFANVDTESKRFVDFERWWSGFYFMNEAEIRWIIENLFVGNRLATGKVGFKEDENIDLRRIECPVIIFASHGDDITPPQQALNWIADAYDSVDEIKALGRRIAYIIDDEIGHLGLFVSSRVARTQHNEMALTLDALESLPPGLYEMVLVDRDASEAGDDRGFWLKFEPRTMDELLIHDDGRDDERYFELVSEFSQKLVQSYEKAVRPVVKSVVTEPMSQAMFRAHPLRQQRYLLSDEVNPAARPIGPIAEAIRSNRHPVGPDNPFVEFERLWADTVQASWDAWVGARDLCFEFAFFGVWASPWAQMFRPRRENGKSASPNRGVQGKTFGDEDALRAQVTEGGYVEAVTRMLLLIAAARGTLLRSRLNRATTLMRTAPYFKDLDDSARQRLVVEQARLVQWNPNEARQSLTKLLPAPQIRQMALELVLRVAGPRDTMTDGGRAELDQQIDLLMPTDT